jgi:hypothetical protein
MLFGTLARLVRRFYRWLYLKDWEQEHVYQGSADPWFPANGEALRYNAWGRKNLAEKTLSFRLRNFFFGTETVRPNRKLSPKEIMEREALRRGICPDCGVDAKKRGGKNALGGPCPYHTDF